MIDEHKNDDKKTALELAEEQKNLTLTKLIKERMFQQACYHGLTKEAQALIKGKPLLQKRIHTDITTIH